MGRTLIVLGLVSIAVGLVLSVLPIRLGRLPGDIVIRGKNSTFYFPVVTCLSISVVLTPIVWHACVLEHNCL